MYFFSLSLFNAHMKTTEQIRRENLLVLVTELGSVKALAEQVDRSEAQVSQWINGSINSGTGKPRGMAASSCRLVETRCLKPVGWLDADHGIPKEDKKFDENVSPARLGGRPIPVISAVQAGALKDMETPYSPGAGFAVEYTDDENLSRWAFSLEVEGESMTPDFRPGDRVIIDPDLAPNPGDFVVAKNGGEQATFKKYRPRGMDARGNTVFELVPLNDDYATLRSDTDHLVVIGVMVEHRKRYRRSRG